MKKKGNIFAATIILMAGTVLSKTLGFARELVVAYKYGAGSISDAFLLTNGIPEMIFSAVGIAIGINYVPICQRLKDREEQDRFTSNLLNIILVVLLAGCILINFFPQFVLKFFAMGLADETERYAVIMLRIVMFAVIPITVSHLFQAYSQVNGRFHTTALFGVITNIVMIAVTLLSCDKTYYLLSIGTILANTAGMLVVIYGAGRSGYRYSRVFEPFQDHIKALIVLTVPLLAENIASNMSLLVDRNLASFLDSGTISGLSYAGTLGNVAVAMISGAIITATFPSFAKLTADHDYEGFEDSFNKYAYISIFLLCPVSMAMLFHAKDIVIFIFEHGAFGSADSRVVWESMACYAAGIVPLGIQSYLIRGFYALQDTKTPVKVMVFSLVCNIVLNLATVRIWRHIGIALSTSISAVIAYVLLTYFLYKKYNMKSIKKICKNMLMGMLISFISGAVSYLLFNCLLYVNSLFLKLMLEMIIFAIVYIVMLLLVNRSILVIMVNTIKKNRN